jgi:predicted O-methyltransferase YrrM
VGLISAWRGGPPPKPASPMPEASRAVALAAKGFLSDAEGARLYELAYAAAGVAPCLEIGSYCGKSAIFLGEGCRARGKYGLFSIDHHGGSEEQQPGQQYFDPELYDAALGRVNTLPFFLENVRRARLEDWVFPIVGTSAAVAANWRGGALGLVFIDGGHAKPTVEADARGWSSLVVRGGWLCFHDVYPNPADGGQAPREAFEAARASGAWRFDGMIGSLGVLRRR